MKEELIISLVLLALVILDAIGDASRDRGWQQLRHSFEALQIGVWLTLCVLIGRGVIAFDWTYVVIYTIGRVWAFDYPNNLIAQRPIGYVGKSSLDGRIYHWMAGTDRERFRHPVENFSFIIKFMALLSWIALIVKA